MSEVALTTKRSYRLEHLRGRLGNEVAFILPDGTKVWAPGGSHNNLITEDGYLMDLFVETLDKADYVDAAGPDNEDAGDEDWIYHAMENSADPTAWFLGATLAVRNGAFGEVGGMKAEGSVDFEFGGRKAADITREQAAVMVDIMRGEALEDGTVRSHVAGLGIGDDVFSRDLKLRKPTIESLYNALVGRCSCGGR